MEIIDKTKSFWIFFLILLILIFILPLILYLCLLDLNISIIIISITGNISVIIYSSILFYEKWIISSDVNLEYENHHPYHIERGDKELQVIRVSIKNMGKKILKNCEGKAEIIPQNGDILEDAAILHWSRHIITEDEEASIDIAFKPITINRGDKEYLDVIKSYNDKFYLFSDRLLRNIGIAYGNGIYNLTLTIFSEDLPKPKVKKFKLEKNTGYKNIKFEVTEKN